jgi:DNA repair exonuclease SbcCD ATPase subunit
MLTKFVLPFIGGNHPFSKADLEGVEVAAVLISVEGDKKRNEQIIGIFKTYLPLWLISIDGSNGILVEALGLNSQAIKMRRFDKIIELNPERDLSSSSLADFISKLKFFESQVSSFQKEAKLDLDGYLDSNLLNDINLLFQKSTQESVDESLIMSKRLTQQGAESMTAPIISIFHIDVPKILSNFYELPILINTQLLELYNEFHNVTKDYINRITELKQKVTSLNEADTFEKQQRAIETLTHELTSFQDTQTRAVKRLQAIQTEINQLADKIQQGYLTLLSSIFQTKQQIIDLGVPLTTRLPQAEAVQVLLPVYFAVFKEKKNRISYIPPFILHFDQKQELSRSKGHEWLKQSLERHYSQKIPPGLSQLDDANLLLQTTTQQKFNDGVHKLRETKILNSNSYVRIMDTYNKFFREAQKP